MASNFRSFIKDMDTDFPTIDKFKKDYKRQQNEKFIKETQQEKQLIKQKQFAMINNQQQQNSRAINNLSEFSGYSVHLAGEDGKKQEKQFYELVEKNERIKKQIKEREEKLRKDKELFLEKELEKRLKIKEQNKLRNIELRQSLKLPAIEKNVNVSQDRGNLYQRNGNSIIFKTAEYQNNPNLFKTSNTKRISLDKLVNKRPSIPPNKSVLNMSLNQLETSPTLNDTYNYQEQSPQHVHINLGQINERPQKTVPYGAKRRSTIRRNNNLQNFLEEKGLLDLSVKEVIHEIDLSVKTGNAVKFKDFGLRNSAIVQLLNQEKEEVKPRRKDFMRSVEISKRFLDKKKEEKNLQMSLFDRLDKSLAITNHENNEDSIILNSNGDQKVKFKDPNDLMFPTEVDNDYVIMESEEDFESNQVTIQSKWKKHEISQDQFKPLLKKLIQSSRKKGEFQNIEERIMNNYKNGIGIHNIFTKSGKKIPPSIILQQGVC
eukprot:403348576